MALANYVKFRRGTPAMFDAIATKDADCLYFISEKNATKGLLYLGDKLISGNITSDMTLSNLEDVLISSDIPTNSMLIYDAGEESWISKPFSQIFEEITHSLILITMTGATENRDGAIGTVPKPLAGQQEMFLRGDGTWTDITKLSADRERELSKMRKDLSTLIGDDILLSSRDIAAQEIKKVVAGASADFRTLEQIEGWIVNQGQEIAQINTNVNTLAGDLNEEINKLKAKDANLQLQINDLDERLQWRNINNP